MMKRRASFACSIFSPPMLPEESRTKTRSFGITAVGAASIGGVTIDRKKPSSPGTRYVSTVIPIASSDTE